MLSDEAVLSTLVYASLFGAAISKKKLFAWLITSQKISAVDFSRSLVRLHKRRLISFDDKYVSLEAWQVVGQHEKKCIADEKITYTKKTIRSFSWIPWIQGIAITGSVAAENANTKEDVDLMIVVADNALWIVRLLVSLILGVQGKLRIKYETEVRNKMCVNLWLDRQALAMSRQTLYVAREVVQANWIYERDGVRSEFLDANSWVTTILAQTKITKKFNDRKSFFPTLVNYIAYYMQRVWMGEVSRKERVGLHFAFFHPADKSKNLMREYHARRNKILKEYHGI